MTRDDEVSPSGATEPAGTNTLDETLSAPGRPADVVTLPDRGYDMGEVIGRGGMGEVVSAHDRRIGRDVAIKRMRGATPSSAAVLRFLREARIQARLDHPAIVPVYELGTDAEHQPYFVMKRIAGTTLGELLAQDTPLPRLLRAFVDVCLAIQYAHERGVIHRDLKPANIILGEYGEVYVLDWGIARVSTDPQRASSVVGDIDTLDETTQTGDLLGTPGYMAPEQIRGVAVTAATDVYALGAILFELLAGQPLHPRGAAAIASTLATPRQSPAARAPERELAPELDELCVAALADEPEQRPSARALGDRIQRFLDGDRDIARRRVLAAERLEAATRELAAGDPERRASAMRDAGYALALDPSSEPAARLVSSLIVEPPRELPAELQRALAAEDRRLGKDRLKASLYALVAVLSIALLTPLMTISNPSTYAIAIAAVLATLGVVYIAYRHGTAPPWMSAPLGLVVVLAFSRVLGEFVLTPTVIAAIMFVISANPALHRRPVLLVGWLAFAVFAPLVLEEVGAFSKTWWLIDGGVCSVSAMLSGRDATDAISLIAANLVVLVAGMIYALSVHRRTAEATHRLFVQHWHLEQLLPRP